MCRPRFDVAGLEALRSSPCVGAVEFFFFFFFFAGSSVVGCALKSRSTCISEDLSDLGLRNLYAFH